MLYIYTEMAPEDCMKCIIYKLGMYQLYIARGLPQSFCIHYIAGSCLWSVKDATPPISSQSQGLQLEERVGTLAEKQIGKILRF